MSDDDAYMRLAIAAARDAEKNGDVPVGALVVVGDAVIATAANEREVRKDPTAHAEVLALRRAADALGTWRLTDATLYVTLEPCPMCAGALVNSRIKRVVFGSSDPKAGAVRTLYRLLDDSRLNHRCDVTEGVLAEDCALLLTTFFERKRARRESRN